MIVKKSRGKIYGASLSKTEKNAMDLEIRRQLAEYDKCHILELDAMILWVLHEQFGFGYKRLRRFFECFAESLNKLLERYDMDSSDRLWICTRKLKEYGIDLEEWYRQRKE